MSEPTYLSPRELAEKLEDARCTSCGGTFTEKNFENDEVLVVPDHRLAHYECWFNHKRPKMREVNLSEIAGHPFMSLLPSDYLDQDEEE